VGHFQTDITPLVLWLFAFVPVSHVIRLFLESSLKSSPPDLVKEPIRPAELAFIAASGELTDVVTVMAVDLLQRAVKARLNDEGAPEILDYEERMWQTTRDFVSRATQDKLKEYHPENAIANPLDYAKRVSGLYQQILVLVKKFSHEIVADPKKLRRYFNVAGIVRLTVDLSTSLYRERLFDEMTDHLVFKGLLVAPRQKESFAKKFVIAGSLTFILSAIVLLFQLPVPIALSTIAIAIGTAIILEFLRFAFAFVPFYSELAELLGYLRRSGWRIRLLRSLIYSLRTIAIVVTIFVFLTATICGWLLMHLFSATLTAQNLLLIFALSMQAFVSSSLILRGMAINNKAVATTFGEQCVQSVRKKLSHLGPFEVFTTMLNTDEYDPTFSEMVAIYGIAPLLLLV
jgi:hypothetical protein